LVAYYVFVSALVSWAQVDPRKLNPIEQSILDQLISYQNLSEEEGTIKPNNRLRYLDLRFNIDHTDGCGVEVKSEMLVSREDNDKIYSVKSTFVMEPQTSNDTHIELKWTIVLELPAESFYTAVQEMIASAKDYTLAALRNPGGSSDQDQSKPFRFRIYPPSPLPNQFHLYEFSRNADSYSIAIQQYSIQERTEDDTYGKTLHDPHTCLKSEDEEFLNQSFSMIQTGDVALRQILFNH
jgi:hypothetical protein